ncbi:rhodanese-like domain-containing protein [Amycolatopsis keratiniphila]|uniref:rhodanese-like domain-containing protein n=1 Tax=Amycolatopsis keratiniphila TaxID=129921 RepID=UPI000A780BDF|nr:rhodanese-like domain-containing protein [Amycolatopsis keratiniphila]
MLAGLDDVPAYYTHMGPINAAGPAPVDLTPPRRADAAEIAERLAAGEWVVDLRSRIAFADGHVAGSVNIEGDGSLATYLAWLMPWNKPVTLLGESPEQVAAAQRELVRVGVNRPAAAGVGTPEDWVLDGDKPSSFPRAGFAELAAALTDGQRPVVLDVRRDSEREQSRIEDTVHIPIHSLPDRVHEVPPGRVWVHCASGLRAAIGASLLDAAGRDVVAIDDDYSAAGDIPGLTVATGEEERRTR